MDVLIAVIVVVVLAGVIAAARSIKTVQQYEDGIIFRFGRVMPGIRGAGLTFIRPIGDKLVKVNKQIIAMAAVPPVLPEPPARRPLHLIWGPPPTKPTKT